MRSTWTQRSGPCCSISAESSALGALRIGLGRLGARDAVQRGVGARERSALGLECAQEQVGQELPREQLQGQAELGQHGQAAPPGQDLDCRDDRGEQKDRDQAPHARRIECPAPALYRSGIASRPFEADLQVPGTPERDPGDGGGFGARIEPDSGEPVEQRVERDGRLEDR